MMRFFTRDLLWAAIIVAIGLAWWTDKQTKHAAIQQSQRLHPNLSLAMRWHYHWKYINYTGIQPPPPTTLPDWTVLEERIED